MHFRFATATEILFGTDSSATAAELAADLGRRALVVTGSNEGRAGPVTDRMHARGLALSFYRVSGEPSTAVVDAGVARAREDGCDLVVAVGGGSAIDTGKAIAALLTNGGGPLDYLEVIGAGKPLSKRAAPFVAVPTTAGSGSEVTRNAVISSHEHRVKVSMRSPLMLPHVAVVDPLLTQSMPRAVTASTGLDALTHLIEAFVSNQSNALTDTFCREGIGRAASALRRAYEDGDAGARVDMAMASLLGGLALANAKLGAVHGFAGPVGGMYAAPHGCICGRLLPHVIEANVAALSSRDPTSAAIPRFEEVARLLTGNSSATAGDGVRWVQELCGTLVVPSLASYGLNADSIATLVDKAARSSSMKGNPIRLTSAELHGILARELTDRAGTS